MFFLQFIIMLCNVWAVATPISAVFVILIGVISSLAKGNFSEFGQYILVFFISISISGILLLKSLAISTIHKEKITPRTQAIASFVLALIVLVLGLNGFNSNSFQIHLSFVLGFIGAGALFWVGMPDKLLGNAFKKPGSSENYVE